MKKMHFIHNLFSFAIRKFVFIGWLVAYGVLSELFIYPAIVVVFQMVPVNRMLSFKVHWFKSYEWYFIFNQWDNGTKSASYTKIYLWFISIDGKIGPNENIDNDNSMNWSRDNDNSMI